MSYALLSILAAFASYAAGEQPRQINAATALDDEDKKICRMIVPTGSIMGKRFCLTKQEWKEMNTRTGEDAATTLARSGAGKCDGKCSTSPGGMGGF